jgi:hypothetical protein
MGKIVDEGGSQIFMNITATKCKTARSWILDILTPPHEKAWLLSPTPLPELPKDMTAKIEQAIQEDFQKSREEEAQAMSQAGPPAEGQTPPTPGPQSGPPAPAPTGQAQQAQETLKEMNEQRRDIKDAVSEEIMNEAKFQLKKMEVQIEDQLAQGGWEKALSDFVTDFTIYPTAFLKGPIISKKKKITWVNGEVEESLEYKYECRRVDPLDIYPSADATSILDGSLIEHLRMNASELTALKGVEGYDSERIDKVLESGSTGSWHIDTGIETDKTDLEERGDEYRANRDVIHGMHFHGPIKVELLRQWGFEHEDISDLEDRDVVEAEAIVAGEEVIKAQLNTDPLKRRPYYKASYMDLPGSFWGRSLPMLMNDIQRMCNATARALANNMGMTSGLQVMLTLDRLADDGDIEDIRPRKIWQMKSDPSGNSSKPIEFFQPTSNAKELLEVYDRFESRADDVTGVPKYAYGNDPKTAAGRPTVGGLSLMLESASKIIKDAIRNIDTGLIKPYIEQQFYHNLEFNEDNKYTGDVNVVPRGSTALTVKAAQQIRRNELLAATANPMDQTIMGPLGRAELLREIGTDLGMKSNIIPSNLEIKQAIKKQEMMRAQEQPEDHGVEITRMQTESAQAVAQLQSQLKQMEMQMKGQLEQMKQQMEMQKEQAKHEREMLKLQNQTQVEEAKLQTARDLMDRELAYKIKTGEPGV